jgi:hypothetical protein
MQGLPTAGANRHQLKVIKHRQQHICIAAISTTTKVDDDSKKNLAGRHRICLISIFMTNEKFPPERDFGRRFSTCFIVKESAPKIFTLLSLFLLESFLDRQHVHLLVIIIKGKTTDIDY